MGNGATAAYDRGNRLYEDGDLEGAEEAFSDAICQGWFAEAYNNRGVVRKERGDFDGALADFREALRLDPENARAYYNRAHAKHNRGKLEGAVADYTEALRIAPEFVAAYGGRGNARWQRGDLDGALADYNVAIRTDPQHTGAYYNRGRVKQAKGDLQGALADYAEAIRLGPDQGSDLFAGPTPNADSTSATPAASAFAPEAEESLAVSAIGGSVAPDGGAFSGESGTDLFAGGDGA